MTRKADYPVRLEPDDNGTVLVSFPDFPEAHTFGDDGPDALLRAQDALATVIDAYIKDRRPMPAPSEGLPRVPVPALVAAKVQLYEAMLAGRIKKSELARRLHWHLPQVDRLLDIRHGSKLEQLEAAAAVMGRRLVVLFEVDPDTPFSGVSELSEALPKRSTVYTARGPAAKAAKTAAGRSKATARKANRIAAPKASTRPRLGARKR